MQGNICAETILFGANLADTTTEHQLLEAEVIILTLKADIEAQSAKLAKLATAALNLIAVCEIHPSLLHVDGIALTSFVEDGLKRMALATNDLRAALPK